MAIKAGLEEGGILSRQANKTNSFTEYTWEYFLTGIMWMAVCACMHGYAHRRMYFFIVLNHF
jgi:hypothetical protein